MGAHCTINEVSLLTRHCRSVLKGPTACKNLCDKVRVRQRRAEAARGAQAKQGGVKTGRVHVAVCLQYFRSCYNRAEGQ